MVAPTKRGEWQRANPHLSIHRVQRLRKLQQEMLIRRGRRTPPQSPTESPNRIAPISHAVASSHGAAKLDHRKRRRSQRTPSQSFSPGIHSFRLGPRRAVRSFDIAFRHSCRRAGDHAVTVMWHPCHVGIGGMPILSGALSWRPIGRWPACVGRLRTRRARPSERCDDRVEIFIAILFVDRTDARTHRFKSAMR